MAFIEVNFTSKKIKRTVTFNALIPADRINCLDNTPEIYSMKTLYLLNGYRGNHTDWICGTKIQELSLKFNLAVIMPSGENNFYLDDEDKGEFFGEFIGEELPEFAHRLFNLSDKKEDTWIGGLSMGGYGAIRNGLKYSDRFGRIIGLSSALITDTISGIPEDYKNEVADYKYFRRIFGDLNRLKGSDKDPEELIKKLRKENKTIPEIYMACGTNDTLIINENRKYRDFLLSENIKFSYNENPGEHNWDFWNEHIEKAIKWALGNN